MGAPLRKQCRAARHAIGVVITVNTFTMAEGDAPSTVGVISDANGLCDVFSDVFGAGLLAATDKDTIVESAKQNLNDAHLHLEYDFPDGSNTQKTAICEHTSQFTGCRLWIDEDSGQKIVFISETDAAAYEYQRRGFVQYEKNAISNISLIPQKVRRAGTEVNIWDRLPPVDVKIPRKLPNLPSDKVAETIIREFEAKVVDVEADEVYSPIRLWTQEERKGIVVPHTFCTRLNQYYAIRALHANVDPKDLKVTATKLKLDAREAMKGKKDKDDFWYLTCVELYDNSRNSVPV